MGISKRPGGYDQAIRGNRWHNFLYLLLRDHLPAGVVEAIVCDIESAADKTVVFSNDFVAGYAIELNARLHGEDTLTAHGRGHDAIRHAQQQKILLDVEIDYVHEGRPGETEDKRLRVELVDGEAQIPFAGRPLDAIRIRVVPI